MSRLRQILKLDNLLPITFYFKQKKINIQKIYNKREILAKLQSKFYCSECMGKGFINCSFCSNGCNSCNYHKSMPCPSCSGMGFYGYTYF